MAQVQEAPAPEATPAPAPMKAIRQTVFHLPNYGNISFVPDGKGSFLAHRVLFRRLGEERLSVAVGWLQAGMKPNAKQAIFFAKIGCALEDNLPRHHYADKGLIPPPRQPRK